MTFGFFITFYENSFLMSPKFCDAWIYTRLKPVGADESLWKLLSQPRSRAALLNSHSLLGRDEKCGFLKLWTRCSLFVCNCCFYIIKEGGNERRGDEWWCEINISDVTSRRGYEIHQPSRCPGLSKRNTYIKYNFYKWEINTTANKKSQQQITKHCK